MEKQKYKCCKCGKEYTNQERNFNKIINHPLYKGNNERLHVCKECLLHLLNHYMDEYKDKILAIKRICQMFDIYFNEGLANSARNVNKSNNIMTSYISKINLGQYSNKTYDNTLMETPTTTFNNSMSKKKDTYTPSDDVIAFFGEGFKDEEYKFLEKEYKDWSTRTRCETKSDEEYLKSICFNRMNKWKLELKGEKTKDIDDNFNALMKGANLEPRQNSNTFADNKSFGVFIKMIENEKPIDEADDQFKDVDKIGLLVDVFFKGALIESVGIKTKTTFSKLYKSVMDRFTVKKSEYQEDEVNEHMLNTIFGRDKNE